MRSQEIPAWMLDQAVCRKMRRVPHSIAELGALAALRALLLEVVATRVAAEKSPSPAVASPDMVDALLIDQETVRSPEPHPRDSAAASFASASIFPQSPALIASPGTTHEPPTQATFFSAR